jgi:hypothetical protein
MKDRKRAAVEAAIAAAIAEQSIWTSEFVERVTINPVAARARVTEMFTGSAASLCLVPASDDLRAERYHAICGESGKEPHLFVVVVVSRETYEATKGIPPDKWQMRLSPPDGEEASN